MNSVNEIYEQILELKNVNGTAINQIIDLVKKDYPNANFCRDKLTKLVTFNLKMSLNKLKNTADDLCALKYSLDYTDEQFDNIYEKEKLLFQIKFIKKHIENSKPYYKKRSA